MSFYYKLHAVNDNINKENPVKGFVAISVKAGTVNLNDIAEDIASRMTFSAPEVKAILECLVERTEGYLSLGHNVTLADLGTFSIAAQSRIVNDPDEIRGTSVKMKRIVHRPSRAMTERLRTVSFLKME